MLAAADAERHAGELDRAQALLDEAAAVGDDARHTAAVQLAQGRIHQARQSSGSSMSRHGTS